MTSARRIVIVGGVAAGLSAAMQARRRLPASVVTVVDEGERISRAACGTLFTAEDPDRPGDESARMTSDRLRSERGIDLRLRHRVIAVDPERRTIDAENIDTGEREQLAFDALVLATGASAAPCSLPGAELEGVSTLRRATETVAAHDDERAAAAVAVLGNDLRAVEVAGLAAATGVRVCLCSQRLLPGWLDGVRAVVADVLLAADIDLVDAAVTAIDGEKRVEAIVTDAGRRQVTLVVVVADARPRTELARSLGLRRGATGAVWVNQYQETSCDGIWAAGDCAEVFHRLLRRNVYQPGVTIAAKQGRIAGANACGAKLRFRGAVGTRSVAVLGHEIARTGLGLEEARQEGFEPVAVVARQRSRVSGHEGGSAVTIGLVADGPSGLLLGAELVAPEGAIARAGILAAVLAAHGGVADLQALDLAHAARLTPVWDPIQVAANQLARKVDRAS